MKTSITAISLLLFAIVFMADAKYKTLNINTDYGLSTNYTYCQLVDNYGYLWIGSDQGLYRYNGYSIRRYSYADGLNSKDIWWLYQDSTKKIWLFAISDQLSYIYNNEIHQTVNTSRKTLYPKFDMEGKNYFSFLSLYNLHKALSLCIVKEDSVFSYNLPECAAYTLISGNQVVVISKDDSVFAIHYSFSSPKLLRLRKNFLFYEKNLGELFANKTQIYFHHYWIAYEQHETALQVIDMNTNRHYRIATDFPIRTVSQSKAFIYIVGDFGFYRIDTSLRKSKSQILSLSTGSRAVKGAQVSNILDDPLWQTCLATKSKGVYISYRTSGQFQQLKQYHLNGFRYVGDDNQVSYWWDNERRYFGIVKGQKLMTYRLHGLNNIERVIGHGDSLLAFTNPHAYWINLNNKRVAEFSLGGFNGVIFSADSIYVASEQFGFYTIDKVNGTFVSNTLDYERYKGMVYDSLKNLFLLYNSSNVVAFRNNQRLAHVTNEMLRNAGVKHIEKILTDRSGNIFVLTDERLILIDIYHNTWKDISGNYILSNTAVSLQDDILTVAGRFGVFFRCIYGRGKVSKAFTCRNEKSLWYKVVEDMAVTTGDVILKTDKDVFTVKIPSSAEFGKQEMPEQFKLIANNGGTYYDLHWGDTIRIKPNNPNIQFDLIRPSGVGTVTYNYVRERRSTWPFKAVGNNLFLTSVKPDRYYKIFISVQDEIWRSRPTPLYVYVIPAWWQRRSAEVWLWMVGGILVLLMIGSVVMATKAIVTTVQERKTAQLELELKAIHSQINPHFIFNTLGIALYFLSRNMVQQASEHVRKFSDLLRAYLKSSRNRLVTIAEEIMSLKNYIELQQVRFQHKFSYSIVVDNEIDTFKTEIPALLLQPIVENAINHGLLPKKELGHLQLNFKQEDDGQRIIITIEDNGVGREQSLKSKGSIVESYGSALIGDLVRIFNKYEQMRISIQYIDKEMPESGTIVTVVISFLKQ